MKKDILYLGSSSKSRHWLLDEIKINHKVLQHKSDESLLQENRSFYKYVLDMARDKMKHLVLPENIKEEIFVLTADTMGLIVETGQLLRKPKDLQDAKKILVQVSKQPVEWTTGCCLEKKIFKNGSWENLQIQHWVTSSILEFIVDQDELDRYLENIPQALVAAGAGITERFGSQYVKSVKGSPTTIMGLPLFELRLNLKKMGFKF